MDKVNLLLSEKFPMYVEGLNMIQEAAFMSAKSMLIGGNNYILDGCLLDENNNVSNGYIVVNGEILPFVGGELKPRFSIVETRKTIHALGVEYPEAYTFRVAQFANNGAFNWSDFEPIQTNNQLYQLIKDITGDPAGTIKEWAGMVAKIPKNYMLCDGRELSITAYPELFDNLGTMYGGDGVNSFKLPNMQGLFSVGYDNSKNDYNQIGKTGGEEKHKLTADEIPAHNHTDNVYFNKLSARAGDIDATNTPSGLDPNTPDAEYRVGGMTTQQWKDATIKNVGEDKPHENRPPYIVVAKIIKVR